MEDVHARELNGLFDSVLQADDARYIFPLWLLPIAQVIPKRVSVSVLHSKLECFLYKVVGLLHDLRQGISSDGGKIGHAGMLANGRYGAGE